MKKITYDSFMDFQVPVSLTTEETSEKVFVEFCKIKNAKKESVIQERNLSTGEVESTFSGCMPKLSPDGKKLLYGKQKEDGYIELYVKEICSGVEKHIGSFLRAAEGDWSRDSQRIIFSAALPQQQEPKDLPELESVIWIDRLKFKTDGVGLCDGTYRGIVIWDLQREEKTLVIENRTDLSAPCFVGTEEIAFLGRPFHNDNSDDVYLYICDGKGMNLRKYQGMGGPMHHLKANHAGTKLAVIAHDNKYWEATNFRIYLFDKEKETWECFQEHQDWYVGNCVDNDCGFENQAYSLEWDERDKTLYVPITRDYCVNIYAIDFQNDEMVPAVEEKAVVFSYGLSGKGLVFISSSDESLWSLKKRNEDGAIEVLAQSRFGARNYELSKSITFYYADEKNRKREAKYYPALGQQKGVILNIHGGPHYCHGYDMSYDIQLLATNGYGTVLCNPAGSLGSGEEISIESHNDWGGKDFRELLICVEQAKKEFQLSDLPWAVMGGSYGGFMTNWMIGHVDIFKCAISERSTCNRYSQAGTSDCAFRYGMFEFDGLAWENPQHYMSHSPISYVKKVNTPVLILHGDKDMNCAISQSEEWYSALKMEGKEAYFAVFPGQFHDYKGSGTPLCRKERYQLILWWLNRFMGSSEGER